MQLVVGSVDIDDVNEWIAAVQDVGDRFNCVIQAVDARYVVDESHLEHALILARRARDRDDMIADDPALEILLYAAATRQIEEALQIGVSDETTQVAIVIDGKQEKQARKAVMELIEKPSDQLATDPELVAEWFGITATERETTDAGLGALVRERVSLLTVEK